MRDTSGQATNAYICKKLSLIHIEFKFKKIFLLQGGWKSDEERPEQSIHCRRIMAGMDFSRMKVLANMGQLMKEKKMEFSATRLLEFLSQPRNVFYRIPFRMIETTDRLFDNWTEECLAF